MANGQQIAQENFDKFLKWSKTTPFEEFAAIVRGGILNRQEIATQVGISKSALSQNPRIKEALKALEDDLREKNILPQLLNKSSENAARESKTYDYSAKKVQTLTRRNAQLEATIVQLEAKLDKLKRYSETADVFSDFFES
jgi:ribosomal protein S9